MKRIISFAALLLVASAALAADNTLLVTPCSSGCVTTKSKDVGSGVQAPQPIISDVAGNPIYGTAGTANSNVLTVQGIASGTALPVSLASVPSHAVTNAGTFATQSAVTAASGSYSSGAFASGALASGSVASGAFASGSLAAGSMVDLLTMRQTVAAGTAASNSFLGGGVYNSTPITMTNTQGAALQVDANGYLKVNTAAGAAAGGTSSNFGSAFPTPGTAVGFTDGTNMVAAKVGAIANVAAATNLVNTIQGCQYNATPVTVTDTRYQSLQCDVNGYTKVNVTNTNANGQATMANSSPVVIASNQSAVPVSVASGGIASGAVASGAYASGAFASGSVASGAYASGSLASGAVVDITNMSATLGAAPPAKGLQTTALASGATGGLVQSLIQCDSTAVYDASTSGSTELKALTSGRTIYVCGYTILSGGTVNVKLIYGTGTACATGSANMTPAYQLTAQVGAVDGSPFYRGMKTASANALCINTSAGVAVQALVYYSVI